MRYPNYILSALIASIILFGVVTNSNAATEVAFQETLNIPSANNGVNENLATFVMPQFDPSLGTLQSIDVTINGDSVSYFGQNSSAVYGASAYVDFEVALSGYSIGRLVRSTYSSTAVSTLSGTFAAGQVTQTNDAASWGASAWNSYLANANVVGTSTVSGFLYLGEGVGYQSGNSYYDFNEGQSFSATGYSVSVGYNYTPLAVPEANTSAMMLFGLPIVGFLVRRRKKSTAI